MNLVKFNSINKTEFQCVGSNCVEHASFSEEYLLKLIDQSVSKALLD